MRVDNRGKPANGQDIVMARWKVWKERVPQGQGVQLLRAHVSKSGPVALILIDF
jgi:hypothetical protein